MASNVSRTYFRSRAAASPTTFESDGGSVDDTQKRFSALETIVAEIKASMATKIEVEQVRGGLGRIEAILPYLATKAEIEKLHASVIKWVVGAVLAGIVAAYSVARFIH